MRLDSEAGVSPRRQTFEAVLERGDRALGWTIARMPFVPGAVWPELIRLRVCGAVNGFPFRTSLFPESQHPGGFYLLVNRAVQSGAGVQPGDVAHFDLEPDMEPRPANLPEELHALLDEAEGLRAWYDGLSEYTRREIGKWILSVKSDEARMRRAQQMGERLLATMEAEVDLPPAIELAFRRRPRAREGWARMTEAQRRSELMAVFSYQSVESREKRLGKMCDAAEKRVALTHE